MLSMSADPSCQPVYARPTRRNVELDNRISTLQVRIGIKLSTHDYQKVMQLSRAAVEKTHAKTKLNQLQNWGSLSNTEIGRLNFTLRD